MRYCVSPSCYAIQWRTYIKPRNNQFEQAPVPTKMFKRKKNNSSHIFFVPSGLRAAREKPMTGRTSQNEINHRRWQFVFRNGGSGYMKKFQILNWKQDGLNFRIQLKLSLKCLCHRFDGGANREEALVHDIFLPQFDSVAERFYFFNNGDIEWVEWERRFATLIRTCGTFETSRDAIESVLPFEWNWVFDGHPRIPGSPRWGDSIPSGWCSNWIHNINWVKWECSNVMSWRLGDSNPSSMMSSALLATLSIHWILDNK